MSEQDAVAAVQWLSATGTLDFLVREHIAPAVAEAVAREVNAAALAAARAEGAAEAFAKAAKVCEAVVPELYQARANVPFVCAAAIRELAEKERGA